jgi:hypothetical protein
MQRHIKVMTNVLKFADVNSNVRGKATGIGMNYNDNFFSLEKILAIYQSF